MIHSSQFNFLFQQGWSVYIVLLLNKKTFALLCYLTVNCCPHCIETAQSIQIVRDLQDVDVIAPADACFACEVSLPAAKAPTWTLNGQTLHPGPKVVMEKMGTVHRLTLKQTSEDMSGTLCFISGKAKSTSHLCVRSTLCVECPNVPI